MQRERQNRDVPINSRDVFDGPRGFASRRSMISSIFGGRDPFDDPFFSRPFGSMFEPSIFDTHGSFDDKPQPNTSSSKALVIEELGSDDEGEGKSIDSGKAPVVEHPDDEVEEVKKDVQFNVNRNRTERPKPQTHGVSFKRVAYGGINGTYYTATTTRKSGSDGVVIEDSKEADKTTGQATHMISKGLHEKGHSVTRKLGTDGKVDTVQTLHNLNEDELAGFEQEWKGNADMHIPGWHEEFSSFERAGSGRTRPFSLALKGSENADDDNGARSNSSGGRPKKVVTINID